MSTTAMATQSNRASLPIIFPQSQHSIVFESGVIPDVQNNPNDAIGNISSDVTNHASPMTIKPEPVETQHEITVMDEGVPIKRNNIPVTHTKPNNNPWVETCEKRSLNKSKFANTKTNDSELGARNDFRTVAEQTAPVNRDVNTGDLNAKVINIEVGGNRSLSNVALTKTKEGAQKSKSGDISSDISSAQRGTGMKATTTNQHNTINSSTNVIMMPQKIHTSKQGAEKHTSSSQAQYHRSTAPNMEGYTQMSKYTYHNQHATTTTTSGGGDECAIVSEKPAPQRRSRGPASKTSSKSDDSDIPFKKIKREPVDEAETSSKTIAPNLISQHGTRTSAHNTGLIKQELIGAEEYGSIPSVSNKTTDKAKRIEPHLISRKQHSRASTSAFNINDNMRFMNQDLISAEHDGSIASTSNKTADKAKQKEPVVISRDQQGANTPASNRNDNTGHIKQEQISADEYGSVHSASYSTADEDSPRTHELIDAERTEHPSEPDIIAMSGRINQEMCPILLCDHCDFTCFSKDRLSEHTSTEHPGFYCGKCGHKALSQLRLSVHMSHKHPLEKKTPKTIKARPIGKAMQYSCHLCEFKTVLPDGVRFHLKAAHSGTRSCARKKEPTAILNAKKDKTGRPGKPWSRATTTPAPAGSINPLSSRFEVEQTMAWIRMHFKEDPHKSLLKNEVYKGYLAHCADTWLEALSLSEFGKVMKEVYPQVLRHRLGKRRTPRDSFAGLQVRMNSQSPDCIAEQAAAVARGDMEMGNDESASLPENSFNESDSSSWRSNGPIIRPNAAEGPVNNNRNTNQAVPEALKIEQTSDSIETVNLLKEIKSEVQLSEKPTKRPQRKLIVRLERLSVLDINPVDQRNDATPALLEVADSINRNNLPKLEPVEHTTGESCAHNSSDTFIIPETTDRVNIKMEPIDQRNDETPAMTEVADHLTNDVLTLLEPTHYISSNSQLKMEPLDPDTGDSLAHNDSPNNPTSTEQVRDKPAQLTDRANEVDTSPAHYGIEIEGDDQSLDNDEPLRNTISGVNRQEIFIFTCSKCGYETYRLSALRAHMRSSHADNRAEPVAQLSDKSTEENRLLFKRSHNDSSDGTPKDGDSVVPAKKSRRASIEIVDEEESPTGKENMSTDMQTDAYQRVNDVTNDSQLAKKASNNPKDTGAQHQVSNTPTCKDLISTSPNTGNHKSSPTPTCRECGYESASNIDLLIHMKETHNFVILKKIRDSSSKGEFVVVSSRPLSVEDLLNASEASTTSKSQSRIPAAQHPTRQIRISPPKTRITGQIAQKQVNALKETDANLENAVRKLLKTCAPDYLQMTSESLRNENDAQKSQSHSQSITEQASNWDSQSNILPNTDEVSNQGCQSMSSPDIEGEDYQPGISSRNESTSQQALRFSKSPDHVIMPANKKIFQQSNDSTTNRELLEMIHAVSKNGSENTEEERSQKEDMTSESLRNDHDTQNSQSNRYSITEQASNRDSQPGNVELQQPATRIRITSHSPWLARVNNLLDQLRSAHGGNHIYSCTMCFHTNNRQCLMVSHISKVHGRFERAACIYCERRSFWGSAFGTWMQKALKNGGNPETSIASLEKILEVSKGEKEKRSNSPSENVSHQQAVSRSQAKSSLSKEITEGNSSSNASDISSESLSRAGLKSKSFSSVAHLQQVNKQSQNNPDLPKEINENSSPSSIPSESLARANHLLDQLKSVHTLHVYSCAVCIHATRTHTQMALHVRVKHGRYEDAAAVCIYCDRTSFWRSVVGSRMQSALKAGTWSPDQCLTVALGSLKRMLNKEKDGESTWASESECLVDRPRKTKESGTESTSKRQEDSFPSSYEIHSKSDEGDDENIIYSNNAQNEQHRATYSSCNRNKNHIPQIASDTDSTAAAPATTTTTTTTTSMIPDHCFDERLGCYSCQVPGCSYATMSKLCFKLHLRDDHEPQTENVHLNQPEKDGEAHDIPAQEPNSQYHPVQEPGNGLMIIKSEHETDKEQSIINIQGPDHQSHEESCNETSTEPDSHDEGDELYDQFLREFGDRFDFLRDESCDRSVARNAQENTDNIRKLARDSEQHLLGSVPNHTASSSSEDKYDVKSNVLRDLAFTSGDYS